MKSRFYHGRVWHARRQPAYLFEYGVWYLYADWEEVDAVDAKLALFGHNRLNLTSLHDRDYLALQGDLPSEARQRLARDDFSIGLLTMPRLLGYVFNPVSFWLCRGPDGALVHVLAEVHNTWGERHVYHLDRAAEAGSYVAEADKAFYVSPFMSLDGRYRFDLREWPDGRLRVRIDEFRDGERFFQAGIDVRPLPLTNANLLRLLLRYPAANFKTIAAIHWQGLKLWLRGERFRSNPSRAKPPLGDTR